MLSVLMQADVASAQGAALGGMTPASGDTAVEHARSLAGAPGPTTGVPRREARASRHPASPGTSPVGAALPVSATIEYVVSIGQGGAPLGRATHEWRRKGSAYSIQAVTETTGLAALIRRIAIRQTSAGALGPDGLIPNEYRYERNGELTESAVFDWSRLRLSMTSKGRVREEPLSPGSQDLLSQIYQLALLRAQDRPPAMAITNGKRYRRYTFELVGAEKLDTMMGELRAVHFRTQGPQDEQSTEVWIAPERHNLPVRIRHRDRKGAIYDQLVDRIRYDGVELRGPSE